MSIGASLNSRALLIIFNYFSIVIIWEFDFWYFRDRKSDSKIFVYKGWRRVSPGHPVQGLVAYTTYALHPRRVCLVLCVFVGDICARMRRRATPTNTVA